ncbi:hypothetical protein EV359DRAFT_68387 [Lentinula novae-zelandiae]|nr:hypothetical protein EV359DRAFT_68387 [Lentinula novae-zelandiae]
MTQMHDPNVINVWVLPLLLLECGGMGEVSFLTFRSFPLYEVSFHSIFLTIFSKHQNLCVVLLLHQFPSVSGFALQANLIAKKVYGGAQYFSEDPDALTMYCSTSFCSGDLSQLKNLGGNRKYGSPGNRPAGHAMAEI